MLGLTLIHPISIRLKMKFENVGCNMNQCEASTIIISNVKAVQHLFTTFILLLDHTIHKILFSF